MKYAYIKQLMKEKGLSRRELASRSGISENTIAAAFKRQTKNISQDIVKKIAEVLDVPWYHLYDEREQEKMPDEVLDEIIADIQDKNLHISLITNALRQLNDDGKNEAVKRIEELTMIPKYRKDGKA